MKHAETCLQGGHRPVSKASRDLSPRDVVNKDSHYYCALLTCSIYYNPNLHGPSPTGPRMSQPGPSLCHLARETNKKNLQSKLWTSSLTPPVRTEPAIQLLLLHVEDKHSTVLSALAEDENFLLLLKVGNCSLPVYSPQGEFDSLSL